MQRALVVVDSSESSKDLLRLAGRLAEGVDAQLRILHVVTEEEYEKDRQAMSDLTGTDYAQYDTNQAEAGARQFASDLASEMLTEFSIEYEAIGAVGDHADRILATTRRESCDHIYIAGGKRSPTGKALFGDTAQKVILNADTPVTVVTDES